MTPLPTQIWGLRILIIAGILLLCWLPRSGFPAWAFAIAWSPNGLFLAAFSRGALRLPGFLEPVKPAEPVLYRWLGVGLVKQIVATRQWPMLIGFDPPPKVKERRTFLDRSEQMMRGAEVCHAATFVLASGIAIYCLATGRIPEAMWILGFNLLLNGYPVMLQRTNRWRIQQVRALARDRVAVSNKSLERTCER